MDAIGLAAELVLKPHTLVVIFLAACFGLFVGSIPGLTATMAVALLVPITFFMDPVPAIGAMVTCTAMAIFAGDIPGALLRIPGTPASAAYVDEAFRMTQKGEAEKALGTGLVCSVIGGLIGTVALVLVAPVLAQIALNFSSFEYFWLACLGLTSAVFISTASPVKGFLSLLIGLLISSIGLNNPAATPRFTFGNSELLAGINFIPAMIGMFAVSEILRHMLGEVKPQASVQAVHHLLRGIGRTVGRYKINILRGSLLGTLIGSLPGAGADIAAWIAFAISKKFSREPEKFGTGHVEGLTDASSANNGALGGAWVPALVFGIPGDSITAIVIGVLYVKGMNPGPTVFLMNPQNIYAVFIIFFAANLMMLPLGYAAIKSAKQVLRVPRRVLMPIILLFCMVGSFAINNTVFDIGVMLVLGVVGFVMEENGFPIAPTILGIVLGQLLERTFVTSLIRARGDYLAFFERPIAAGLGVVTVAIWLTPLVLMLWRRHARRRNAGASP
ncbi:MAG: tripartite tricarboxylate transporter permease [Rhodospirillaceae bacterium]|nr:tripartite tricarboxylate transporter permease [Rhodospirillaceae bacterium]